MNKPQAGSIKIKAKRLSIRRTRAPNRMASEAIRQEAFDQERESPLPPKLRSKLWTLFAQIEREFECIHAENLACKYTKMFYVSVIVIKFKVIPRTSCQKPKGNLIIAPLQHPNYFRIQVVCSNQKFVLFSFELFLLTVWILEPFCLFLV